MLTSRSAAASATRNRPSFVGDLKVGYMSTYKNLNLGMSYGLSAGDAGRQNHAIEATMRVDF